MKVGARTLKTGLAVGLAIFIAELFSFEIPAFAAIAAFLAIQPSIFRSYKHLWEQIQANLVGGGFAFLTLMTLGNDPIVVGIMVIVLISVNYKIGFQNIGISILTALAIITIQHDDSLLYALQRFSSVVIGIFASLIINVIFLPPNYETRIQDSIHSVSEKLSLLLRTIMYGELDKSSYSKAKKEIDTELKDLEEIFSMHKDDLTKNKIRKAKFSEYKRIVIYGRLIDIIKTEQHAIYSLKEHEKTFYEMEEETRNFIQNHLIRLTSMDEKLLLKHSNSFKKDYTSRINKQVKKDTGTIIDKLLNNENFNMEKQEFNILLAQTILTLTQSNDEFGCNISKLPLIQKKKA